MGITGVFQAIHQYEASRRSRSSFPVLALLTLLFAVPSYLFIVGLFSFVEIDIVDHPLFHVVSTFLLAYLWSKAVVKWTDQRSYSVVTTALVAYLNSKICKVGFYAEQDKGNFNLITLYMDLNSEATVAGIRPVGARPIGAVFLKQSLSQSNVEVVVAELLLDTRRVLQRGSLAA